MDFIPSEIARYFAGNNGALCRFESTSGPVSLFFGLTTTALACEYLSLWRKMAVFLWEAVMHKCSGIWGRVIPASLALALLAGCNSTPLATPATELANTRVRPAVATGDWQRVAVDKEVKALADYAAATLGDLQQDPLNRILKAQVQQASGSNYAMVLEFSSGKRWQVGLYRDLDGMLHITNSRRL